MYRLLSLVEILYNFISTMQPLYPPQHCTLLQSWQGVLRVPGNSYCPIELTGNSKSLRFVCLLLGGSDFMQGAVPDFLQETAWIRNSSWKCAPTPADLQDRRVEITGPTDRKMVINALNSGASCFMADFEDASMYLTLSCLVQQLTHL